MTPVSQSVLLSKLLLKEATKSIAVSQIFDRVKFRVKSVALWSANNQKTGKGP